MSNLIVFVIGGTCQSLASLMCGTGSACDSPEPTPPCPPEPQLQKVYLVNRDGLFAEEGLIALKAMGREDASMDMVREADANGRFLIGEYTPGVELTTMVDLINQDLGQNYVLVDDGKYVNVDPDTAGSRDTPPRPLIDRIKSNPIRPVRH